MVVMVVMLVWWMVVMVVVVVVHILWVLRCKSGPNHHGNLGAKGAKNV